MEIKLQIPAGNTPISGTTVFVSYHFDSVHVPPGNPRWITICVITGPLSFDCNRKERMVGIGYALGSPNYVEERRKNPARYDAEGYKIAFNRAVKQFVQIVFETYAYKYEWKDAIHLGTDMTKALWNEFIKEVREGVKKYPDKYSTFEGI